MSASARGNTSASLPISAIIINWNGGQSLDTCVSSLLAQPRPPGEIVVVDNGSADGSAERVARQKGTRVLYPDRNLGFAGGSNYGAAQTAGANLLFLNPDVEFLAGALDAMLAALDADPLVGVVGPTLLNADRTFYGAGLVVDRTMHPFPAEAGQRPFFVSGCALLARRDLFEQLDGFDGSYFLFSEDLDLCWRAQLRGWRVQIAPTAEAIHEGGASIPGGYVINDRLTTTPFRLYLRERNTLAAVITNYAAPRAFIVAMVRVCLGVAEASVFALRGDFAASAAYVRAFVSTFRGIHSVTQKRRRVQSSRQVPDRALMGIRRGLAKLEIVKQTGLPTVDRQRR